MATPTTAQQKAIADLYIALFNRAPDANGFAFWTQALADGASLNTIAQNFVTTPEARTVYPESQTAEQFVSAYYSNVLGRPIDANGLAFWTQLLQASGGVGSVAARANVVSQIVEIVNTPLPVKPADLTDEAYALTFADRNAFKNKGEVAVYFAVEYKGTDLTLAKQVLAVVGPTTNTVDIAKALLNPPASGGTPPVAAPVEFNGTAGVDEFVAGSADTTFKFVIDNIATAHTTLNLKDVVTGGAGNDTLTVSVTGNVTNADFTNATITGIENVVITRAGASTITYDAGVGVQTVTVEGGSGAVQLNNLAEGSKFIVKDSAGGNFTGLYPTGGSPDITLSNVSGTYVTGATAGTSLTLTSTGAGNTLSGFNMGPNISTMKIIADAAFTTAYLNGGTNVKVEVTGTGAVDLGSVPGSSHKEIDASANTGGLAAVFSSNAMGLQITGSAGNNAITTGIALTDGFAHAGAGTGDRLIVTESAALSDSTLGAKYTGFEILRVSNGVSVDLTNINGITSVEIADGTGTAGVTNLSAAQAAAVSILSANATGAITIGVAGAATLGHVDTVKATLSTAGSQAINLTGLTLTGVEKLELTGTGTTTAATGLVTLNTANATALDAIVVKNAGGAGITVAAGHAATGLTIDASDSAGVVTIDASAYATASGASIKGGSGGGTLTGSAKADTIVGGAGDDIIIGDRMLPGAAAAEVQTISLTGVVTSSSAPAYLLGGYSLNISQNMTAADVAARIVTNGPNNGAFLAANPNVDSLTYDSGSGLFTITYKASAGDVMPITAMTTPGSGLSAASTAVTVTPGGSATPAVPVGNGTHDTLTGGGGANTFRFYSADNDVAHGTITTIITDFKTGADKIDLTVTGPTSAGSYLEANAAVNDLATLLTDANAALNGTVRVYVGQIGADSFVVSDLNGTGYTNVIQLTGVSLDGIAYGDFIPLGPQ